MWSGTGRGQSDFKTLPPSHPLWLRLCDCHPPLLSWVCSQPATEQRSTVDRSLGFSPSPIEAMVISGNCGNRHQYQLLMATFAGLLSVSNKAFPCPRLTANPFSDSSRFHTWPAGKVRMIGYRLHPQFAFNTFTTQRELFCTDTFATATNPPRYSGQRWSSWGDHVMFLYNTQETVMALITSNSPPFRQFLLRVCHRIFPGRYLFSFCYFHYCICCVSPALF